MSRSDVSVPDIAAQVEVQARHAQAAAALLRALPGGVKDRALRGMADALLDERERLLAANARDLEVGAQRGLSSALLDRLKLNEKRLSAMAEGCRQIAGLPDPIGQLLGGGNRPNGLRLTQVRVPLGVIGIIYESRPNVTVDAAALCLKSGNACILRGGSEALHSNTALMQVISEAATREGVPSGAMSLIETTDRAATNRLVTLNGVIDLVIPRGGEGLKKALMQVATVPVIFAAGGVCHVFVDASADVEMALEIAHNAKVSRPSTCNALETLLVHREIAGALLPRLAERSAEVELRGDEEVCALVPGTLPATEEDWAAEYGNLTLAVKVVDDLEKAMAHIARYGTGHSDAIVTRNYANAETFVQGVDSAAVYVNASTRFTDGFEFGLGAEIGISTQKLHARGPMGLEALTTTKWIVRGDGQLRS